MKKYIVLCAGICAAMAFTSCKSSESAYKQAYLKAKAQEAAAQAQQPVQTQQPVQQTVVTPLEERVATNTRVVNNADNVAVRQESVSVISGTGLKNFSVVVGSFSLNANAEGLQQRLQNQGYPAQIVLNRAVQPAMYRVVATTFDSKEDAVISRNDLQVTYPGAWLLYAK